MLPGGVAWVGVALVPFAKLARRFREAGMPLKMKITLLPERAVNVFAVLLRPLFWPPVIVAVLVGLVFVLGFPTTAIDTYNAQDIDNRRPSPSQPWQPSQP